MDNKSLLQFARQVVNQYQGQVSNLLGIAVPDAVNIQIGQTGGGLAETNGNTITLDPDWFKKHPKDKGLVVHELAHVFMAGASYTDKDSWIQEGLADYVRDKVGLATSYSHADKNLSPFSGYQGGATFFKWLADKGGKQAFSQFVIASKAGDPHPFMTVYKVSDNKITQAYQTSDAKVLNSGNFTSEYHGAGDVDRGPETGQSKDGKGGGGNDQTGNYITTGSFSNDPKNPPSAPPTDGGKWTWDKANNWWVSSGAPEDPQEKYNRQNALASYTMAVKGSGLDADDPNLQTLITHAVKGHWNMDRFYNNLYDTPQFHNEYPGIFDENGNLKMSPEQYKRTEQAYMDAGARYGIDVGNKKLGYLFANDVSPSEFGTRATAMASLRDNADLYEQFNKVLKSQGDAPLNKDQLFKFVLGEGNEEWYKEWNLARTRYQAVEAGLKITKKNTGYTSISPGMAKKVAGMGLSDAQMAKDYGQLAQALLTTLPASKIAGYGITKKQLQTAAFGGKHSAELRQKIDHIMNTDQAFSEGRATAQTYSTAEGQFGVLGSAKQRPQA